ncbi:hypothetical protein PCC7424_4109 [Gloeothece citriformis PCC 7424]|uniref:Uncharacterized protein n=1 Tax=Gloeothece citriformis (strain PCC 7424) TaxID=65393 RepID=B7KLA9_GLOC7|nr:hypothetical protein [Gloeothece citriformis]ACK72481.1 hypothetical protein PCC7424_4109 [Gloeothece citriformis PCC 7424]
MGKVAKQLKTFWESCLLEQCKLNSTQRRGVIRWLLGENTDQIENLSQEELASAVQGINNRYRILQNHYLGVTPEQAYRHLFNRFGTAMMKYSLVRHWLKASPEHQKIMIKTFEGMIEQILRVDPYLRGSQNKIALCVEDTSLRNALLLTTIEEYCLVSINNHPLLLHLLSHFLHDLRNKQQISLSQNKFLQLLTREIQCQLLHSQSPESNQLSYIQQNLGKIAFEQALKNYRELQLVG